MGAILIEEIREPLESLSFVGRKSFSPLVMIQVHQPE
jgi:hypothetical protein